MMKQTAFAATAALIAATMGWGHVAQSQPSPASSVDQILTADRAATAGSSDKAALSADYAFSGMGLTGKASSLTDLRGGRYVESMAAGPLNETDGFDGAHAWVKENSGTVTQQDGGDQHALAVNEAYRRANLWWRSDRGGAAIAPSGRKQEEAGGAYDVIVVTPAGGKPFEAWFGAADHRLARVVEKQGPQTISTRFSDYRPVDGVMLPGKTVVDDGEGAKNTQTLTLVSARFQDAPPAAAFEAPKAALADFAITGGAGRTVLPFTLINNHVYAEASVNGKGPYRFIFDTGGVNLVTPAMARTIGLAVSGSAESHGAGEGAMEVGFTKVAELKVAEASIKDQAFAVLPLDALSDIEGVGEQGMVGYETFRRFVTRIDYGAHTITLIDPKQFDPANAGTPIHFDFADHNPEIAGTFEGLPGKFRIDTGSRVELTLNKPFVEKNGLRANHTKGMEMVDGWGIGGPSRAYVTRGASLKLGGVEIKNVVASMSTQAKGAFAGDDYQGNIGGGILKRFVVTFDYGHQTLYLKPLVAPADAGTFDRAGMWFNVSGDGFKVVDVTAGGPADAAGIKVGDQITAVDRHAAGIVPVYDLRKRLRNTPAGARVSFTIMRGGQSLTKAVVLRDLI